MRMNRSLASAAYTIRPPALLRCSRIRRPSAADTIGVPRGAMMSIASCTCPRRGSVNPSRSVSARTPTTGTRSPLDSDDSSAADVANSTGAAWTTTGACMNSLASAGRGARASATTASGSAARNA